MELNYNLELVTQLPIKYNGLIFYPISFKEICEKFGWDSFTNIIFPFKCTKDCFDMDNINELNLFEDIILKNQQLVQCAALILNIFCKCKKVVKNNNNLCLYIDKDNKEQIFLIDKNNFEEVSNIILSICGEKKIEIEKPPDTLSEKQLEIWKKIREGRRNFSDKNKIYIYDILNVCEFAGAYHISIDEIMSWTLWKINNCYNARLNLKNYEDNFQVTLITGDNKNISRENHWFQKLLIRE